MGAYGSPEMQPPDDYKPLKIWQHCRCCGDEYEGRYCPHCGTKAGDKKPNRITGGFIVALLIDGMFIGAMLLFFLCTVKR